MTVCGPDKLIVCQDGKTSIDKKIIFVASILFIIAVLSCFYFYKQFSISIYKASWDGNLVKVEEYIENNPKLLESKDEKKEMTPLHYSAWHGKNEVVKYLLSMGADTNVRDNTNSSPLMYSVASNHLETSELLIEAGADINAKDFRGMTALHDASQYGYLKMVELLLDYDASPNIKSNESSGGLCPLHLASLRGHIAVVESLVDYGAMVDCKSATDRTPLYCAVEICDEDIVKLLLRRGADPHIKLINGKTCFELAKDKGEESILKLLKEYSREN